MVPFPVPAWLPLLLLLSVLLLVKKVMESKKRHPPGPSGLPLIGNMHQLGTLAHQSLFQMSNKYGPIIRLKLGSVPLVVVSSPETAREIIKVHDTDTCSRPKLLGTGNFSYNYLDIAFAPFGEYWREMRKISVLELFSNKRVQSFRFIREEEVDSLVESVSQSAASKSPVDLSEKLLYLTANVIWRVAFGGSFEENKCENGVFQDKVYEATSLMGCFAASDFFPYVGWIVDRITGLHGRLQKSAKELDDFLLLVGYKKSGTSSLYKQAKLLHKVPFTEDECQSIKLTIQTNLYNYFGILLEGRERFEEESLSEMRKRQSVDHSGHSGDTNLIENTSYSIGRRLKIFSDWLLRVMASGNLEFIFPAASREYAPFIEELWKDKAIQATYNRRRELEMLPGIATYFLERAVEISRIDYEPSDMDILYAEGIASSNGISCTEFSFPNSAEESSMDPVNVCDSSLRYQLIRVHPRSLGENCKWLAMFEDVDIVVFCVSLTDYDEFVEYSNGVIVNKMLASRQLFETIVAHPTLTGKKFLLILNKFDSFEEKIEHVPLTKCEWFHDFNPVISRHNNALMAQRAFHYIAVKFKRLFQSLTAPHVIINRKHKQNLFVSQVTALKQESVEDALKFAREILKWNVEEPSFNNELSTTMEESTTS